MDTFLRTEKRNSTVAAIFQVQSFPVNGREYPLTQQDIKERIENLKSGAREHELCPIYDEQIMEYKRGLAALKK